MASSLLVKVRPLIGSALVGVVQADLGESTSFTRIAAINFPTVITLWVTWMGVVRSPGYQVGVAINPST